MRSKCAVRRKGRGIFCHSLSVWQEPVTADITRWGGNWEGKGLETSTWFSKTHQPLQCGAKPGQDYKTAQLHPTEAFRSEANRAMNNFSDTKVQHGIEVISITETLGLHEHRDLGRTREKTTVTFFAGRVFEERDGNGGQSALDLPNLLPDFRASQRVWRRNDKIIRQVTTVTGQV